MRNIKQYLYVPGNSKLCLYTCNVYLCVPIRNQRTNGPVNAHLISRPSKAQNIQNLEIHGKEMTLTFNTHIPS